MASSLTTVSDNEEMYLLTSRSYQHNYMRKSGLHNCALYHQITKRACNIFQKRCQEYHLRQAKNLQ